MKFRHHDTVNGCVGALDIPTREGRVTVAVVGDSRADALGRAALIAERIASDPVMSALMPPQALAAIKAAKGLASAAKRGTRTLRRFWGHLHGPGKRRLAAALHEEAAKREASEDGEPSTGDLGWNPFRKRKRRVRPMRRVAPRPEPEPEPEPDDDIDDTAPVEDVEDVDGSEDGDS